MSVGVLIVDDDADMRVLMQAVIDSADKGLRVRGAVSSGEEALARVTEVDPDVVVLDQAMPGLTGVETAALLRSARPAQQMVLFTAYLTPKLAAAALAAGVAKCLNVSWPITSIACAGFRQGPDHPGALGQAEGRSATLLPRAWCRPVPCAS
jgi:DNA-binding NarL/FixJ family response regulator